MSFKRPVILLHIQHVYIYTRRDSPCFSLPLLAPLCSPFVSPSTYLAPSSCDRNRPPQSQVACKLTPSAPPFTQPTPPLRIPRTPTAQRLTKTTSRIFRLLLTGTLTIIQLEICSLSLRRWLLAVVPLTNKLFLWLAMLQLFLQLVELSLKLRKSSTELLLLLEKALLTVQI